MYYIITKLLVLLNFEIHCIMPRLLKKYSQSFAQIDSIFSYKNSYAINSYLQSLLDCFTVTKNKKRKNSEI